MIQLPPDTYGQAIIHATWFGDNATHTYQLLFAMVELRPTELPIATASPMDRCRYGSAKQYAFYQRFPMSVDDALRCYDQALHNLPSLPPDPPCYPDETPLRGGPFVQIPDQPTFLSSRNLPFAPDWMRDCRVHFLFPEQPLAHDVRQAIADPKISEQLNDWLHFDLVEAYDEFQGTFCVLAPNPVFRSIRKVHLERPRDDCAESLAYKIVTRDGRLPDGVRLEITNELPIGRTDPMVHTFGTDPVVVFDAPAPIHAEGRNVTHTDFGLLHWREPHPIIRGFNVNLALGGDARRVKVPDAGKRRPAYEYDADRLHDAGTSTIGESTPHSRIISRITRAAGKRHRKRIGRDQDQQWFYKSHRKAADFVRRKIRNARESVLIADPYFNARALMAFAHASEWDDVDIKILASAEGLKESTCDGTRQDVAGQLHAALETTFTYTTRRPEIRVMRGKSAPLHDRFLAVDGEVWFPGNSFDTLGDRAGLIIRLPDPDPVVDELMALWSEACPFDDWLARRESDRSSDDDRFRRSDDSDSERRSDV